MEGGLPPDEVALPHALPMATGSTSPVGCSLDRRLAVQDIPQPSNVTPSQPEMVSASHFDLPTVVSIVTSLFPYDAAAAVTDGDDFVAKELTHGLMEHAYHATNAYLKLDEAYDCVPMQRARSARALARVLSKILGGPYLDDTVAEKAGNRITKRTDDIIEEVRKINTRADARKQKGWASLETPGISWEAAQAAYTASNKASDIQKEEELHKEKGRVYHFKEAHPPPPRSSSSCTRDSLA